MHSKLALCATIILLSSGAHAKAPLQVDFNQMIDEGSRDRAALNQNTPDNDTQARTTAAAKSKVIDFIDLEIGVSSAREASVVERD